MGVLLLGFCSITKVGKIKWAFSLSLRIMKMIHFAEVAHEFGFNLNLILDLELSDCFQRLG